MDTEDRQLTWLARQLEVATESLDRHQTSAGHLGGCLVCRELEASQRAAVTALESVRETAQPGASYRGTIRLPNGQLRSAWWIKIRSQVMVNGPLVERWCLYFRAGGTGRVCDGLKHAETFRVTP